MRLAMPRRPPRFDPLSPAAVHQTIVRRLVKREVLDTVKGAWGRELALLKKLQREFAGDTFWLSLTPAEPLDTLAYFAAPYGRAQLREYYNLHLYSRAQDQQIAIDSQDRIAMIETTDAAPMEEPLPPVQKKRDPISWADSV